VKKETPPGSPNLPFYMASH